MNAGQTKKYRFNTLCIHGRVDEEREEGTTIVPIYQNTAYAYNRAEELEEAFLNRRPGYIYSRLANPTVYELERRVSELEGAIGSVACASGMAAITVAVMSIARSGDEIVSGNSIFGGTYSLFAQTLARYGIKTRFVESTDINAYERAINSKTRLVFVETIGNPKLDVPDIRAIAGVARKNGIPLIVDNTVTSPFLFRPREFGANIVIHSSTKFMDGSGSSVGGILCDLGTFEWDGKKFPDFNPYIKQYGEMAFLSKVRREVFRDFGPCMAPMNAYLTTRGIETLALRVERHCKNAYDLAAFLETHPKVKELRYPALPGSPWHDIVRSQFGGCGGGLLTFRLGSKKECFRFINALRLARNLANLGDVRTLVIHPASTIYVEYTPEEKEKMGAPETLVRISVGLEAIEDIIDDFKGALEA